MRLKLLQKKAIQKKAEDTGDVNDNEIADVIAKSYSAKSQKF